MPTKIEWTDESWNPVTGCTNISPGCDHCYAETITNRFKRHPWNQVTLHPDRLDQPSKWKQPRKIFLCSMGDLFHSDVPWTFLYRVFNVMRENPHHTFQILTKRPGRMMVFANTVWPLYRGLEPHVAWPSNVWAGTSVEQEWDGKRDIAARLGLLAQIPAAVRFVSYEPALGPVDFRPWLQCNRCGNWPWVQGFGPTCAGVPHRPSINWVIAGGESGPLARPVNPDWLRAVRDQCQRADVPLFFKQWGEWLPYQQIEAGDQMAIYKASSKIRERWEGELVCRLGKQAAGAMLDGREWRELPEVSCQR